MTSNENFQVRSTENCINGLEEHSMSQLSRGCRKDITAFVVASVAYVSHALGQVPPAGLQWGPRDPGNGPWAISTYDYDPQIAGTPNPVILFGYNQAAGGFPFLAGQPG